MNKELIYSIEMPNYPRKIKISSSRRAKYFLFDKVNKGTQVVPKKYGESIGNIPNEKGFCWNTFSGKSSKKAEIRLWNNKLGDWVIKNPKVAGTENWKVINGNGVFSKNLNHFTLGKFFVILKGTLENKYIDGFYYEFLKTLSPITKFPLYIECEVHDLVSDPISKNQKWDVYNRGLIYCKAFDDSLTELGLIPDDNIDYIHCPSHPIFIPIIEPTKITYTFEPISVPKLVFKIYHIC